MYNCWSIQFMQRVSQKEEKAKIQEEVVVPTGDFPACSSVKRWYHCLLFSLNSLLL